MRSDLTQLAFHRLHTGWLENKRTVIAESCCCLCACSQLTDLDEGYFQAYFVTTLKLTHALTQNMCSRGCQLQTVLQMAGHIRPKNGSGTFLPFILNLAATAKNTSFNLFTRTNIAIYTCGEAMSINIFIQATEKNKCELRHCTRP